MINDTLINIYIIINYTITKHMIFNYLFLLFTAWCCVPKLLKFAHVSQSYLKK